MNCYYKYDVWLSRGSVPPIKHTVYLNYPIEREYFRKTNPPKVWFINVFDKLVMNACKVGLHDFWNFDSYELLETLSEEEFFTEIL